MLRAINRAEEIRSGTGTTDAPFWKPLPGPQSHALKSPADVIGYGGQAGGGKSDLLVGLGLIEHSKAIIFRREFPQIKDIVQRAKEISSGVRTGFNGQDQILSMPGGRTLEFGSMKDPDDWEKYKGRAHDLKAYDEVTEFLEAQVRRSMAWCRTTKVGQRCRVVFTFNPPTNNEGRWIVRFFAPWLDRKHPKPALPGELRWYALVNDVEIEVENGDPFEHAGETIYPQSRTFIPAKLSDNPYLDNSPEYRRVLQSTPEPLRSQLLYGDFDAGSEDDQWQLIPTAWIEAAQARWRPDGASVAMTCIGQDVAHGGKDQTVLAPRYGNWFGPLGKYAGKQTPNGASAAVLTVAIVKDDAYVNVDAIGYGASCQERLAEDYKLKAIAVNVAEKSDHKDRSGKYRMVNKRAEMYWRLREALDPEGGDQMALPLDPELLADLTAPKYQITPSGIKVESKDDIKVRLGGRSPDCGDAVALAMLPYMQGKWEFI